MTDYQQWVGKTLEQRDSISPAAVKRFCATFGLEYSAVLAPAGYHWCLCLPDTATAQLGVDGHPPKGGFIPPIELPRRMWAASNVEFLLPLQMDAEIVRRSKIAAVNEKTGKSGALAFVEVEHETWANDELAIKEQQTIVYREAAQSAMQLPAVNDGEPEGWDIVQQLNPDPTLLFRYSSLTFNTHRIHYDLPYAQTEELYPERVVHGPLMATQALQLAAQQGEVSHFSFKAISAAFCNQPLFLAANIHRLEAEISTLGGDGRVCLKSSVRFQS